jgi:deoxyribodipyrimidine photo-lyase
MLEGLCETKAQLAARGIQLVVRQESPERGAADLARRAAVVVVDRGYLRIQKSWRRHLAREARCSVLQVESDVVVPVEVASEKEEYAAATIRRKIQKHLPRFMKPMRRSSVRRDSLGLKLDGLDLADVGSILAKLRVDRSVPAVERFRGGTTHAKRLLSDFVRKKLRDYAHLSNDPTAEIVSDLSPYLHFGQISPLYVALEIVSAPGVRKEAREAYLEQLIIRRELSMNFVNFSDDYDSYGCLPDWAKKTLGEHQSDARQYEYSLEELEQARTHDSYWNAAQREMVFSGKMHNYMRMYWGKKILEWTRRPEDAFHVALYLNNKYELDGRDPNGFAGVAWCFGKHDRPWQERKVFGKVRYMNAEGLRRKFDMDAYVRRVGG